MDRKVYSNEMMHYELIADTLVQSFALLCECHLCSLDILSSLCCILLYTVKQQPV